MPNVQTPRKRLREGAVLWTSTAQWSIRSRKLRDTLTTDVVVVGAGISGALIALNAAAAGHRVAIVERRDRPALGSTLASTAMIQFELDTPLIELADRIGERRAVRAYRRSLLAVLDLSRLIRQHAIRAEWRQRPALYLPGNRLDAQALRLEASLRRRHGLPSEIVDATKLQQTFRIERKLAILSEGSGELDPARTTVSLLRAAQRLGAHLYSQCEVIGAERRRSGVELITARGPAIVCQHVIFATGYEAIDAIPRRAFNRVASWAIATKPVCAEQLWPHRALIWEASDPYLYVRTTRDRRIVVGGEDCEIKGSSQRASKIAVKARALQQKVAQLFPHLVISPDYAWSGEFADSPTGLPVFIELPDLPRAMAVLGCGGNGITFSVIAAQVVTAWLAGRRDPDANLFTGHL